MEEREQIRVRLQDMVQPVYRLLQQRRREKLQRIPDQGSIEALLLEIQGFCQKLGRARRIGLVRDKVAFRAERIFEGAQDVVGINPMSQRGDEVDVGLAGAGEIQNGKITLLLDGREKLVQAVARAILG